MLRRSIRRAPVVRLASNYSKGAAGLMDFFRDTSKFGKPAMEQRKCGLSYEIKHLAPLTAPELHELWYVLLRELNVVKTEQHFAWQKDVDYVLAEDPVLVLLKSMAAVKEALDLIDERVQVVRSGEFPTDKIRVTTLYDSGTEGRWVDLDKHRLPPIGKSKFGIDGPDATAPRKVRLTAPEGYPLNPHTHFVARYEPQDIEQPLEIAYNEETDIDKIQLQEDRATQEHYYWAKVQNLWNFYVEQQEEQLGPKEYKLRCEQGHYPEEAPEWWRQRHSHDNMWKYGVWAQRSTLALPEHERAKYARHVHIMDSWETQDEPAPMRTH